MNPVLGYFLCVGVLTPALSLDVFFGLLGRTSRLHQVLSVIRTLVHILTTVSSPFRFALTVAVLLSASALEFLWPNRRHTLNSRATD